jgi:hypothetical protein
VYPELQEKLNWMLPTCFEILPEILRTQKFQVNFSFDDLLFFFEKKLENTPNY